VKNTKCLDCGVDFPTDSGFEAHPCVQGLDNLSPKELVAHAKANIKDRKRLKRVLEALS